APRRRLASRKVRLGFRFVKRAGPEAGRGATKPAGYGSDQRDAVGFETLFTVDNIDSDPLSRIQRVDPATAQRSDVDEHILAAAIRRDEAVALFGFEPFDRAFHDRRLALRRLAVQAVSAGD